MAQVAKDWPARDDRDRQRTGVLRALDRRWLLLAPLAVCVVAWGLIDVRPRGRVEPGKVWKHRTDVTVYTEAGRAFFDGRDPYEVTSPRGWHYLYPPLFALLMAPLSLLAPHDQAFVWFLMSAVVAWGGWRECRRTVELLTGQLATPEERRRGTPRWLSILAVAAVALPVMNCLQRGQVGVLLVYLLLLGFRLLLQCRTGLGAAGAGVVLALPIVLKVTPAMPVGMLVLMWLGIAMARRWSAEATRRAVGCGLGLSAGLLLFLVALPSLVIGPYANARHLRTFVVRVMANDEVGIDNAFRFRSPRNQSLNNAVYRFGNFQAHLFGAGPDDRLTDLLPGSEMPMDHPLVDPLLLGTRLALIGLLLACGAAVSLRQDMLGVAAVFGAAATLTLAVSPLSWGHHYVVWLPGLLLVPLWVWHCGWTRSALGLAISAVVLVWAHYLEPEWMGRTGVLGLGMGLWCVAAMIGPVASFRWRNRGAEDQPSADHGDLRYIAVRHRAGLEPLKLLGSERVIEVGDAQPDGHPRQLGGLVHAELAHAAGLVVIDGGDAAAENGGHVRQRAA